MDALSNAARETLGPVFQQMSQQAAEQAATFAKEQGPKILKEQLLPQVMKSVGADNPGDLAKAGVGKVGEAISGAGGITGLAGKLMSKIGGGRGKGGGTATGYGQKRRMPVQQDIMVSVSVEDAYKGWTEYSRWTEFMHRANTVDSQIQDEEEGEARVKVTEKMWGFKRPFSALIDSQKPNEHIRWKSTEGTKHVGVIAFHPLGDRLTLLSVNVDHAPAGPIEKTARGARFVKRAIRADLHRFKGWIEMKTAEDVEDIEGWLGTIENGKIVQTHEDYVSEQDQNGQPEAEAENGEAHPEADPTEVDEDEAQPDEDESEPETPPGQEDEEDEGEEDPFEDEQESEPEPEPAHGEEPEDEEEEEEEPAAEEDEEPEDEEEEEEPEAEEEEEEPQEEEEPEAEEEPAEEDRPIPTPSQRAGRRRRQPEPEPEDEDEEPEEEPEEKPKPRRRARRARATA